MRRQLLSDLLEMSSKIPANEAATPPEELGPKPSFGNFLSVYDSLATHEKYAKGLEFLEFLKANPEIINEYDDINIITEKLVLYFIKSQDPEEVVIGFQALEYIATALGGRYTFYGETVLKRIMFALGNVKEFVRENARTYLVTVVKVGAETPSRMVKLLTPLTTLSSPLNKDLSTESIRATWEIVNISKGKPIARDTLVGLLKAQIHVTNTSVDREVTLIMMDIVQRLGKKFVLNELVKEYSRPASLDTREDTRLKRRIHLLIEEVKTYYSPRDTEESNNETDFAAALICITQSMKTLSLDTRQEEEKRTSKKENSDKEEKEVTPKKKKSPSSPKKKPFEAESPGKRKATDEKLGTPKKICPVDKEEKEVIPKNKKSPSPKKKPLEAESPGKRKKPQTPLSTEPTGAIQKRPALESSPLRVFPSSESFAPVRGVRSRSNIDMRVLLDCEAHREYLSRDTAQEGGEQDTISETATVCQQHMWEEEGVAQDQGPYTTDTEASQYTEESNNEPELASALVSITDSMNELSLQPKSLLSTEPTGAIEMIPALESSPPRVFHSSDSFAPVRSFISRSDIDMRVLLDCEAHREYLSRDTSPEGGEQDTISETATVCQQHMWEEEGVAQDQGPYTTDTEASQYRPRSTDSYGPISGGSEDQRPIISCIRQSPVRSHPETPEFYCFPKKQPHMVMKEVRRMNRSLSLSHRISSDPYHINRETTGEPAHIPHWVGQRATRSVCLMCGSMTPKFCKTCPGHPALHPVYCFEQFHTLPKK